MRELTSSWRRERPDLDLSNFLLGAEILRIARIVDAAHNRICRSHFRMSSAEMRVLFALRRAGKPYSRRPTDLFRSLLLTSGAITKQVDRLVERGLVARLQDPAHAGGFRIQLTAGGLKTVNAAADVLTARSVIAPALATLGRRERVQGERFCRRLLMELDRVRERANTN
jgi:DNA-binding MarR family transcriptional regulator